MFRLLPCIAVLALFAFAADAAQAQEKRKPNVVIIFADDLGYGDLSCFGAKKIKTPHLDRMAKQGRRFTDFYVSQPVCTPSRASLLTGCYANRVGLEGALNPTSKIGIAANELLLSEMLKRLGYATALFGKWHLGHQLHFHPSKHGFDEYFGIPYPNDCSNKYHPIVRSFPPLPLFDGLKVIAEEPDQSQFTRQITERAVDFIGRNKERPFFLYVPHVMPHVPVFASAKFQGKSAGGVYGDAVEEVDWSVGEILAALKKHGVDENTLVIFTSDNGPFLSYGAHAGSSGPLRGGKLTTFEGGVRVPFIARWPGRIPAGGDSNDIIGAIDLVPTIARLTGGELSKHKIDGKNIWPVLAGEKGAKSPHEAIYFFAGNELHAVRSGPWKLHLPHPFLEVNGTPGKDGKPANFENLKPDDIKRSGLQGVASRHGYKVGQLELSLFNLDDDIAESKNVAEQNPEVVRRLQTLVEAIRADLGDSLVNRAGKNVRSPDRVD